MDVCRAPNTKLAIGKRAFWLFKTMWFSRFVDTMCLWCAGSDSSYRDIVDGGPNVLTRTARRLSMKSRKSSSGSKLSQDLLIPPNSPKSNSNSKHKKWLPTVIQGHASFTFTHLWHHRQWSKDMLVLLLLICDTIDSDASFTSAHLWHHDSDWRTC